MAALPIACDYGGPARTERVYSKPPTSREARRVARRRQRGHGHSSSAATSQEEGAKREAILKNVIQLIQSAAITPGKQHFGIAVKNLNEYFEQGTRPTDYYLSVDARKFLQSQQIIGTAEAVRALESPTFGNMDARHIEDCMLYNEIAHRVAGERLPGETADLPRVRRLFDWMVRQVQLVPDGSLAPPGGQQAYARPYDVLLRGMATEAGGGWSERGWLFMSLCRQLNIDVALLSFTPKRAPAALALAPVSEETAQQPVVWVCVALVDGKAYLFDQRIGMAIPDARGDGVATLQEALADPQILDRLDLPGQIPYRTNRATLLASGKLTILLDSSRGYFSPKMRLLQSRLTGKNRAVLFRDPIEQGRHFYEILGTRMGDLQIWPLPYATEALLTTQPEFTQATLYTLRPFDGDLPLLYARIAQLKGNFSEAVPQFVAMRFTSGALKRDKKTTISATEQRRDRRVRDLLPGPLPARAGERQLGEGPLQAVARPHARARAEPPGVLLHVPLGGRDEPGPPRGRRGRPRRRIPLSLVLHPHDAMSGEPVGRPAARLARPVLEAGAAAARGTRGTFGRPGHRRDRYAVSVALRIRVSSAGVLGSRDPRPPRRANPSGRLTFAFVRLGERTDARGRTTADGAKLALSRRQGNWLCFGERNWLCFGKQPAGLGSFRTPASPIRTGEARR